MYMSELFLCHLKGDYSVSSVNNALLVCNFYYFLNSEKISQQEMRDFADVFREFYDDLVIQRCDLLDELSRVA